MRGFWLLCLVLSATSVLAQAPAAPGRLGIGGTRPPPPLPEVEPGTAPPPALTLPPAEGMPGTEPRLSTELRVFVRRFEILGVTVFSMEELDALAAPYAGRTIGSQELRELQDKLTLRYVDRGYINSGARIPDQIVENGVVRIEIVEGRLSRIDVSGNEYLRPDYVSSRVALGSGPPLNVKSLQSELLLLQQKPVIERVAAELVPGEVPGDAVLRVQVEERPPVFAALNLSNDRPPSIGGTHAVLVLGAPNLTGRGDAFSLAIGKTQGSSDVNASYSIPLTARDTTLSASYERVVAEVIEEPFSALDLQSVTQTYGLSLNLPLIRSPTRQVAIGAALQHRENRSKLLGVPFSFVPGSEDGITSITALRFLQEWVERQRDRAIAARSTISFGLKALGASTDTDPDSRFIAWLGQFQWVENLNDRGLQAMVRGEAQVSSDRLLPMEQFAVGGLYSVRGYRVDQLVRDSGLVLSAELRAPLFADPIGVRNLQLALFADYGLARNKGGVNSTPNDIGSVGLGLLWEPHPRVNAELYWGYRLRDVPNPKYDLQDYGIDFAVNFQFF